MNLLELRCKHPWVIAELEKYSNLAMPDWLRCCEVPQVVEKILVLFAENESKYDVSLGDIVTREPMLRLISQMFPRAAITVVLKPYHHGLNFLPSYENVTYRKTKGNSNFRNWRFFRKTYRDIISIEDFSDGRWDVVVDSTSRDGYALVKDILQCIGRRKIGSFIPANIVSSVWFANAMNQHYRFTSKPILPFKSHQLFVLRLALGLPSVISHYECSTVPLCSLYGRSTHGKHSTRLPQSCLLIDKSPCSSKIWTANGSNPFDGVAVGLQQLGYNVFLHRFFAPDERSDIAPRYTSASPIPIPYPLDKMVEFHLNIRPKLIVGIDTGIMHFLRSIDIGEASMFLSIFANESQDPVVWSPPGSVVFSTLKGNDGSGFFFDVTPSKLIEYVLQANQFNG
jgi:hypothetical protein